MEIDIEKATISLLDLKNNESCPPVIHQDTLVGNNSPTLIYQSGQGLLYIARSVARDLASNWSNPKTHCGNKNLALLSTTIINYSFCAELFLKGILLMTKGDYNRGHNLKELYDDLDTKLKFDLEREVCELKTTNLDLNWLPCFVLCKSKPNANFDLTLKYPKNPTISEFLTEHKTPFVNWRYYFEFNDDAKYLMCDLNFMDCFVIALFEKLGSYENGDHKPMCQES